MKMLQNRQKSTEIEKKQLKPIKTVRNLPKSIETQGMLRTEIKGCKLQIHKSENPKIQKWKTENFKNWKPKKSKNLKLKTVWKPKNPKIQKCKTENFKN